MSATEILDELANLTPGELNAIHSRVEQLLEMHTLQPSPELLKAIDEAEESLKKEGGVSLEEARRP
jgi:hypothetical protein